MSMIILYDMAPPDDVIDSAYYRQTLPRSEWLKLERDRLKKAGRRVNIFRRDGASCLKVNNIIPHDKYEAGMTSEG